VPILRNGFTSGLRRAAVPAAWDGDQLVILENADLVGQGMHLDDAPARAVGDGVEIAADRDHTFAGDAAVEGEDDIEGR
jgi:hypothetical protein